MSIFGGNWTCHVCGESRPDEVIGVLSREYSILNGRTAMTVNTRYCVDRPACRARRWQRNREMAAPTLDR